MDIFYTFKELLKSFFRQLQKAGWFFDFSGVSLSAMVKL